MAFLLTPRFVPAYTAPQCNPWACAPRPQHSYRRVIRPSFPSFAPFLSDVDELISALDAEAHREAARREAHRQRQQRKRIVRAQFNVHENTEGYQIDAELPFFKQEDFEIEVVDEKTLRLRGDTERKGEEQGQATESADEEQTTVAEAQAEKVEEAKPEVEEKATEVASSEHSDTESHRSYQATVEDDFEDLGAEFSSTLSVTSQDESPKSSKGKEKAVEEPSTVDTAHIVQQPQPEAPAQQQSQPEEEEFQFHGSFERTFRFPERIDAANVTATLKNGLLSIAVPKAKAPEVRRIVIQ